MEQKIKEILEKYDVTLGYLFGSYARGTNNKFSDIDVAVVFPVDISTRDVEERKEKIISEIIKVALVNNVDLINLRENENVNLIYDIIFKGKAVLVKDERFKKFLELKAVRDFEDFKYFKNVQFEILKRKLNVAG